MDKNRDEDFLGIKKGFITPRRNNEEFSSDIQTSRRQLTFASLPSGRYMARRTRDEYNNLILENDEKATESDFPPLMEFFGKETGHRQYGEGELVPRLLDSVDGKDIFLFVSPYDPSFVSDGQEQLFKVLREDGLLREGTTLEDMLGPNKGSSKVFGDLLRSKLLNANMQELYNYIRTFSENNAGHIVVVTPYLAYGRQNHPTPFEREASLTRLVADLIVKAGADGIVSYDPHSDDCRGFFPPGHFTFKMINPNQSLIEIFKPYVGSSTGFAFLDEGCVKRYEALAKELDVKRIYISKVHLDGRAEIRNIVGYDKSITNVLFADDICATFGTAKAAVKKLHTLGAKRFIGSFSHGLFSGNALETLKELHANYGLEKVYIADTIPQSRQVRDLDFVTERSIGRVLAKILNAIHYQTSASQHTYKPHRL